MPVISVTLAYLLGLLLGHGFLHFPHTVLACTAAAAAFTALLVRMGRFPLRTAVPVLVSALAGASFYVLSAGWVPSDHVHRALTGASEPLEFTGVIDSALERDPGRTAFVLAVASVNGTPARGKVRVTVREETNHIGYGDTVRFSGRPFEPRGYHNPGGYDYAGHLARSGVRALVALKSAGAITVIRRGTGLFRAVQDRRERIRQALLRSTGGPGSAILQAMVIGEEGGLTDEVRDDFMAAGVTHIISISGSHLGMLAALCFGIFRGAIFLLPEACYHRITLHADPKKIAALLTLPLIVGYTLLAGGQVATVRSLIMISAGLAAVLFDRDHALMHSLALAALAILMHSPQAVFDISFQLSFLSVFIIAWAVGIRLDLTVAPLRPLRKAGMALLFFVLLSAALCLATAPLVAHYFNQFSFVGIVSNLIVVPFAGMFVVPFGLLSGVASLVTDTLPFPGVNQAAADVFISTVTFFARLPFAEIHPPSPGILWIAVYAALLASFAALLRAWVLRHFAPFQASSRLPRGPMLVAAAASVLLLLMTAPRFLQTDRVRISFIDVGQGDSTLLELPGGRVVLIDGGGSHDNRFDIGRRVLVPLLRNKGIRHFDLVILSHPHPDHLNGLISVVRQFDVAELWTSGRDTDLPGSAELMEISRGKKIAHRFASALDAPMHLGEAVLRVISPHPSFDGRARQAYAGENNGSLMVQVTVCGHAFLFTGDAGHEAERAVLRSHPDLRADVIKIPHHGSKSSSSSGFVEAVHAAIAVVSVGWRNPYRHPSDEVIGRYAQSGARLYRTDEDGMVVITVDASGLTVSTQAEKTVHPIVLREPGEWAKQERKNWGALRIREVI